MKNCLFFKTMLALFILVLSGRMGYSQCSELIFSDEFNGSSVDQSKWSFEIGDGCPELCGFGNAEEQYYTAENTTVQNGNLVITTNFESMGGKQYTSSRLLTSGKFNSRFGRYEASIKLPSAGGIWPAFWMLPEVSNWPFTGEIDIMEAQHSNPEAIGGTVHYNNGGHQFNGREYIAGLDLSEGFHEYAVEWEPDEIRWYVDDQLYHIVTQENTVDPWPFDDGDWYLLLNVAVGGPGTPYTGFISPTPADYPTQMEVDYVRVYSGTFNTQLTGDNQVFQGDTGEVYAITPISGATYNWSVPAGASIVSGQGTNSVTVNWGTTGGDVNVSVNVAGCGVNDYRISVSVDPPRTVGFIYEDFESNRNLSYGATTSGVLAQAIANPGSNTTNNSSAVGRYQRDGGSQFDVLFMETGDIGNSLEFVSGKRAIWMEVYSDAPVGTEFILQLENGELSSGAYPSGRHSRYTARTTTQNQWETLEFELFDQPDSSIGAFDTNQFALLIDSNTNTDHTVYFDNMRSMIAPDAPILEETIITNYDGVNQLSLIFENGTYTADVANPGSNSINNSANVARYVRDGASPFDVVSFITGAIENSGPFKDGDNIFYMDIYTSAAVGTEVTISLENEALSTGEFPLGRNSQYTGVIAEQNEWHTIAFTHASSPDAGTSDLGIDEISILFDPNSDTSDTYYFDNFRYGITVLPSTYSFSEMIQDYNGTNNLTFNTTTTGTYTANVSNPSSNSVNNSSQGASYTRNGAELFDVLFFDTDFIEDASAYVAEDKRFAMDVYTSAPVGTVISWQLEASSIATSANFPSGRHSVYQAAVQEQNSWHTLEFILTSTPDLILTDDQIDNIVFLFDPNNTSDDTFYIDNLRSLSREETTQVSELSSIVISPNNGSINQGQTMQFTAQGLDQNGQAYDTSFNWTATGGSIDANGLYTGSAIGTYTIAATSGSISASVSITVEENVTTTTTTILPGILQLEDYKEGGEGIGYHDTTTGNEGEAYRNDDVDIQTTSGGFNVGWIATGEWLAYDINASQTTNSYDINFRVASPSGNGMFHLELDGETITEVISIPNTNGWQNFELVEVKDIQINSGIHELRVVFNQGGLNFDYIEFIASTNTTNPTVASILPGTIEAEDYNEGGEGIGYHDTSVGNEGEAYRDDNVDIQTTTGGYNVGWIVTGEWLAYDINATASSNSYDVNFVVASPSGNGQFHLELDGVSITDVLSVPDTNGWQNYQTVAVLDVQIGSGPHELRVVMDQGGFNFNNFEFIASSGSNTEIDCSETADNGQYSYVISDDDTNPSITFIPEVSGMGDTVCILFYGTSPTGGYPGFNVTPNVPFQINANAGEQVYFYYTYSLPTGGENNTASSRHDFTVGNCGDKSNSLAEKNEPNIVVFPNPMNTQLTISGLENSYMVQVYNITGKLVKTQAVPSTDDQMNMDVSSLSRGFYIIRTFSQDGEPTIHKILKN